MTNQTIEPEGFWRPQYPESNEDKVELEDNKYQTYLVERKPGIMVQDDCEIVDPACFWIDRKHVYLRVNWSMWSTIGMTNPEQVSAICDCHFCRVTSTADNVIKDYPAPVYHISSLPDCIFPPKKDESEDEEDNSDGSEEGDVEYQKALNRITQIVSGLSGQPVVLPHLSIKNETASVVIADDAHALILDILPEDRDFVFTPANGTESNRVLDSWPTNEVSLDFIEKLRNIRKSLSDVHDGADIHLGFLANAKTIEALRAYMSFEGISDFSLYTYDDLGIGVASIFSLEMKGKDESVADRVKEIIVDHLGVDASKVQDDALLKDDLGVDELDFVELSMAFEDAFNCVLPYDALDQFSTVKDIIDYIVRQNS